MSENENLKDLLLKEIEDIKKEVSPKRIKQLKLDLAEKIVHRLCSLADECDECQDYMHKLEEDLCNIKKVVREQEKNSFKDYHANLNRITTHLLKKHNLVKEGYYTEIYMSIGVALGLTFGVAFSQAIGNTALMSIGLPLGIGVGLSIGAGADSKAKKEGRVI